MAQLFREKKYQLGFKVKEKSVFKTKQGLDRGVVEAISQFKREPEWMKEKRFKALEIFEKEPMPNWGGDLSEIDFAAIHYYLSPTEEKYKNWDDVPQEIKETFDKLGIPQAERKFLGGVGAQFESEMLYHSLQEKLKKQGVIFEDMDTALKNHPEIVKRYFGTIISPADNKFAALNSAVWSGGSFVYIPSGVKVDIPLQAYFRINAQNMGQFERTLIIAEEGSFVHYVEGCSAPIYTTHSLHAAVVEIIVKKGARVRYTTLQNWSPSVYNLVTKRAIVYRDGLMEWVDGNFGSYKTMKYPSVYLVEPGARGNILSLAYAGKGQHQDAGAKAVHTAPNTSSVIQSKSLSQSGGRSSYRGLVKIHPGAKGAKSQVRCDALILDEKSRSDTYPTIDIKEKTASVAHEASTGRISEEALFYLKSRGIEETEAISMIVSGFIEPIVKELPLEFAVEMNRLIRLEMEGSVG